MDITLLVPKDKGDIETAEKLMGYSYQEIRPILPQLLTWVQDGNWPVSRPVAKYLSSILPFITAEIIDILRSDDSLWKYWCINMLLHGRKDLDALIINELKNLSATNYWQDVENDVAELAQQVLADIS